MKKYSSLIKDVDRLIMPLIDAIDVRDISKHNIGYLDYGIDKYKCFIEFEKNRFIKVIDLISDSLGQGVVCDLGCFIPYLPVALSLLGYQVKIVDKYELYAANYKNHLTIFAEKNNIELFDLDILEDDFDILGKNDVALLMAVVEHLHGSPKNLFDKIRRIITEKGFLIFEVPNIAQFTKRLKILLGYSPLVDYQLYFNSAYPFSGHNREMTVAEVKYLFEQTGFTIDLLDCYDHYRPSPLTLKNVLVELIKSVTPLRHKGQAILVKGSIKT